MNNGMEQQSVVMFYLQSLGWLYMFALPLAGLVGFATTLFAVIRGRGPLASAMVVLGVLMPILVGLYGTFDGWGASFQVISMSTTAPKPSEMATGIATGIVTAKVGMLLAVPSVLVGIVGGFFRSLNDRGEK